MSDQLLVNVITVDVPPGLGHAFPHGLQSGGKGVAPTVVLPKDQTKVAVSGADATNVFLNNLSEDWLSVTLRCERGYSTEVDAEEVTPFFQNTGSGEVPPAPVQSVSVAAPIVNTGTASDPIIGLGGLSPSPAGTFGSSSLVPVVTVNSAGQVTGVTTQAVTGGSPSGAAGGDLLGSTYPNPVIAAGAVTDTKVATANKDGLAGVASMRTLGTGGQQACAGNDSRLSNSRTPTGTAGGILGYTGSTYPSPNGLAALVDATDATAGVIPIKPLDGAVKLVVKPVGVSGGVPFEITSGTTASGNGPSLTLLAGESTAAGANGGTLALYGGKGPTSGTALGGNVLIDAGEPRSTTYRGSVYIGLDSSRTSQVVLGETRISGPLNLPASLDAYVSITSASFAFNPAITGVGFVINVVTGGPYTLTSPATIATSGTYRTGKMLYILNRTSTAITLQKDAAFGGPLANSRLILRANTLVIGTKQCYQFIYDEDGYWIQAS